MSAKDDVYPSWAASPVDVLPDVQAKLLIIDDVPHNARVLMETLSGIGECFIATRGRKALELAKKNPPDLILLDIEMPDMNGYDVLKALKADPDTGRVPVIFVTAKADEQDEASGLELGAVDFIAKPFFPPVVRARVRNHLWIKFAVERLTELSTLDPLTGCLNRRAFFDAAERAEAQRARRERPYAIVMFDLDRFKAVNDAYGHEEGDRALAKAAAACRAQLRAVDAFGRIGGDEFAALLPETGEDQASAVAETLRTALAAVAVPGDAPVQVLGGSFGVAGAFGDDDATAVVNRADRRLFAAKSAGGDRVVRDEV